jgi:hypothetical protein
MRAPKSGFIFAVLVLWLGFSAPAWSLSEYSKLRIAQIRYAGGNDNPRPEAVESLLAQVARKTSVEVKREFVGLRAGDPALFRYPLLYMAGDAPFEPFSAADLAALRNHLSYGGFLLIDDSSGKRDSGFDASARRMISELFPGTPLEKLSRDHSVFRSFYLLNRVAGRADVSPFLEGVAVKGRTVLAYSANDLGGAWSRSKIGHWIYDMAGGGESRRTLSVRLGVNIVMYALTLDYKKDMVHLPIILERLRRYNSP